MTKENKPEMRFSGFNEDWKQRKVKELCSISTGKSNTQDKVDDGEYPFYVRSPIVERSKKYLYDEEAVLTVGDGVGTGKVFHYVNGKYDLHQRCYRMFNFSEELNAKYFYHIFSKMFYKRVMSMTAKTSVDSVRMDMIADMEIPVPNIKEQEKIGAFFSDIDNLITLQQRKLNSLQKLKKGLLQKMFPKNGENIPEIRFPEFSDAWKQRKLGDILKLLKDGTHGSHKDVTNGHYLLSAKNIKDGRIFWDKTDRIISDEDYKKIHSTFKINKGDVLLTIVGSIGETAIFNVSEEITFQRSVAILRPIDEVSSDFLYSEITSPKFQKFLNLNKSTSAQPGIYLGDLANISFSFPENKEEQKMIGRLFTGLNSTITLQQRKLEILKNIKKSFLQKMFV